MQSRKRLTRRRPDSFLNLRWDMNRNTEYRLAILGFTVSLLLPIVLFLAPFFLR